MEFKQLEMFVALAQARSVQSAAERVFRSQPAVSMAMTRLEEEVGTSLFVRRERYRLTPSGEILYEYARALLELRDAAGRRSSASGSGVRAEGPAAATSERLFPIFLKLADRRVLVVGGGRVAASKLPALLHAGAMVTVVAPAVRPEIARCPVEVALREFTERDMTDAWFALAAAPREVNRRVVLAAERHRVFVNAVDDPEHSNAYSGGVVRRDGLTIAVSTEGRAPALAGLLREGLEAVLPEEIGLWLRLGQDLKERQRSVGVPCEERRPQLLQALNALYARRDAESSG